MSELEREAEVLMKLTKESLVGMLLRAEIRLDAAHGRIGELTSEVQWLEREKARWAK